MDFLTADFTAEEVKILRRAIEASGDENALELFNDKLGTEEERCLICDRRNCERESCFRLTQAMNVVGWRHGRWFDTKLTDVVESMEYAVSLAQAVCEYSERTWEFWSECVAIMTFLVTHWPCTHATFLDHTEYVALLRRCTEYEYTRHWKRVIDNLDALLAPASADPAKLMDLALQLNTCWRRPHVVVSFYRLLAYVASRMEVAPEHARYLDLVYMTDGVVPADLVCRLIGNLCRWWPPETEKDIRDAGIQIARSAFQLAGDKSDADSFVDLLRDVLWVLRSQEFPGPDGYTKFVAEVCDGREGGSLWSQTQAAFADLP
jgi:hypothetical protein